MKILKSTFGAIFLLVLCSGCGSKDFWQALKENKQGVQSLEDKNLAGAEEHFVRGLSTSPFQSQLHHNLGFTLEAEKKMEDAIRSYQNAETLARSPLDLFAARFNLGAMFGQAKKIDEALAWYQKALEVAPDSVEVKTNIELLIKDQQQQGKGGKDDQKDQDKKDQEKKDQDKKDQEDKDKKDDKKDGDKDKDKDKKPPNPQGDPKYKPRPFKGELGENEVKKILGEIKQQEQRIRAEYNRKEMKERPRDKDW